MISFSEKICSLQSSSILKKEAVVFFENVVPIYQATRPNIPEGINLHEHRYDTFHINAFRATPYVSIPQYQISLKSTVSLVS
jgi:hypothetical protein